jgi:hypothetical protein
MIQPERNMRPMTEMRVRAHVNKALAEAVHLGLNHLVQTVDDRHWRVPSTSESDTKYLVTGGGLRPPHLDCTCKAGEFLPYCVHRAAVWVYLALENGLELEVDRQGKVWIVERKPAETYAFPAHSYEALIEDAPPLAVYEAAPEPPAPLEPPALGAHTRRKSVLDDD